MSTSKGIIAHLLSHFIHPARAGNATAAAKERSTAKEGPIWPMDREKGQERDPKGSLGKSKKRLHATPSDLVVTGVWFKHYFQRLQALPLENLPLENLQMRRHLKSC